MEGTIVFEGLFCELSLSKFRGGGMNRFAEGLGFRVKLRCKHTWGGASALAKEAALVFCDALFESRPPAPYEGFH